MHLQAFRSRRRLFHTRHGTGNGPVSTPPLHVDHLPSSLNFQVHLPYEMQTTSRLESAHNVRRASWIGIIAPPSIAQSSLSRAQRRSSLFARPEEIVTSRSERHSSLVSIVSNQSSATHGPTSRPERRNSIGRTVKRLSMDVVQLLRVGSSEGVNHAVAGGSGGTFVDTVAGKASKRASRIVVPSSWKGHTIRDDARTSIDSAALHLPTDGVQRSSAETSRSTDNALGLLLERLDALSAQRRRSSAEASVRFSEDRDKEEAEDLTSTLEYRLDDDDNSGEAVVGRSGVGMSSTTALYRPGSTRASSTLICGSQDSSRRGSTDRTESSMFDIRHVPSGPSKVATGVSPVPNALVDPGQLRSRLRPSASIVALYDGKSAFTSYAATSEIRHSLDDEHMSPYNNPAAVSQQSRAKYGSSYRELSSMTPSTSANREWVGASPWVQKHPVFEPTVQEIEVPEDIAHLALAAEKVLVRLQIEDGVDAVLSRV